MARVPQCHHGHALPTGFVDSELHRLCAHHLAEAELSINDSQRVVFEHNLERLVGKHLARAQPIDVGRNADDPVRVVPDQVGLDQVMRDLDAFDRATTGGTKDVVHESLKSVMSDDQKTAPSSDIASSKRANEIKSRRSSPMSLGHATPFPCELSGRCVRRGLGSTGAQGLSFGAGALRHARLFESQDQTRGNVVLGTKRDDLTQLIDGRVGIPLHFI